MRILRMAFLGLLALVLVIMALANRQIVTVRIFPPNFDAYVGGSWAASMPLFLIILLAMALGMMLGLVWEWLRESQLRAESTRRARDIAELEREVGGLRVRNAQPRDEVLAILDAPAAQRGTTLPARR